MCICDCICMSIWMCVYGIVYMSVCICVYVIVYMLVCIFKRFVCDCENRNYLALHGTPGTRTISHGCIIYPSAHHWSSSLPSPRHTHTLLTQRRASIIRLKGFCVLHWSLHLFSIISSSTQFLSHQSQAGNGHIGGVLELSEKVWVQEVSKGCALSSSERCFCECICYWLDFILKL